jgi:hypothetical protein
MPGLSVSDIVNVQINLSPLAVPVRNFGSLVIAGPSPVIDTQERLRQYTTLDGVVSDFGTFAPEYLAADLFFSQAPQPAILYVGRFAQTATNGVLHGGIFTPAQQVTLLSQLGGITDGSMSIDIDGTTRNVEATYGTLNGGVSSVPDQATLLTDLQAVTDGEFAIDIDGTAQQIVGLDFSAAADLTECGTILNTSMGAFGTASWDATIGRFIIRSATSGSASTIGYATTGTGGGTDVSATLKLTQATGAATPINGSDGMDFSNVSNLNGAATIIQNALVGASCVWDGTRFHITSLSTGTNSTVSFAGSAGTGTNISGVFKFTAATGARNPVGGIPAETALQCAAALRAHPEWYGLQFATIIPLSDLDIQQVAMFIEGCSPSSIFGFTSQDTSCLDMAVTDDIGSIMKELDLERTFGQFCSSSPYASASMFGRAFTVDFEGSKTTITLKFKQEPGIVPELLTESEAAALQAKNMNVFVYYNNAVAIIQEGKMCNGFFFDEVHGTDWQANRIQTGLFNVLYQAPTKIPQTNPGIHILVTSVVDSLTQGVENGLIAPGQWNAPGFGQIKTGQMLPSGFYVWAPLVESQPQSIRETRVAPTIQAAIKLAGAVHKANVILNVNR